MTTRSLLLSGVLLLSLCSQTASSTEILLPSERQDCRFKCHEIPSPDEVLKNFGAATSRELLNPQLSILAWNVYKGRKEFFFRDLESLGLHRDLVLLSEATDGPTVKPVLDRLPFIWNMGISFFMKDMVGTGIATGSPALPSNVTYTRTVDLEPFVASPKIILATTYLHRPSRTEILVLNIHGINWVSTDVFERQIRTVEPLLAHHRGPVLFAGDFNRFNEERLAVLFKVLSPYGLQRIPWENPPAKKQLDDGFYRGFKVVRARYIYDVVGMSSDHPAMDLELIPSPSY